MGQINSYFQLDVRNDGVFIKIFPPQGQGDTLSVSEVVAYLNIRGFNAYDLKELNHVVQSMQAAELRVGDSDGIEINEYMEIHATEDGMKAICRFYPPSAKGGKMDAQEIIKDLQFQRIHFGIKQEGIISFLSNRMYCTDYILAEGLEPVHGKDAEIKYYFNVDVDLKPKRNDDGTVDYHELGTISHVVEGDLLARLYKEDPGKPGKNIFGQEVRPRNVKTMKLSYANNITLSEDRTELYSAVTGHANLVNGKIFVSNIYEVPADVDNSIGNIDYQGNVEVRGNVKGGFIIKAKGDIIVEGVVEDAELHAGGQIIVKRGIHGKTKGLLHADGNIVCKFIENATVISGGYVETEAILHSQVSANTEIHVNGKKGFITGGVIRAGSLIEALTIGSEMGASTKLEVGAEPEKKELYSKLQKDMQNIAKEITGLQTILSTYTQKMEKGEALKKEKLVYVQQLALALKTKQQEMDNTQQQYERLQREITRGNDGRVKIHKSIYPGVTVSISDTNLTLKSERSYCQLLKRQGDVVIDSL